MSSNNESIILGDFNYNVDKNIHLSSMTKHFNTLCNTSGLTQLIKDFTRTTKTCKSILDLILVSEPDKIVCSGVLPVGISDHDLIYCVRKKCDIKLPSKVIFTRNLKCFNEQLFCYDLQSLDWSDIYWSPNISAMWENFVSKFLGVVNKHAPLVERKVRGQQIPWMNDEIRQMIHNRDHYKRIANKSQNDIDWENYKNLRNLVNSTIKRAKKDCYDMLFRESANDTNKLWSTIKKVLPAKNQTKINSLKDENGTELKDAKDIANCFNAFFSTIGSKLAEKFNQSDSLVENDSMDDIPSFKFENVPEESILKQLKKLDIKKATGLDQLHPKFLKMAAEHINRPLAYILNKSLSTGDIPDGWKKAKVSPIHKSNDIENPSNYRPISVIPICMKIFEKVVHKQLYEHLAENDLLSQYQNGFRPGHSTCTALLDVTDYLKTNMDQGQVTGVVYLDLKKAFDTVDHKLLLTKLLRYGINGTELQWFTNYLQNRSQSVSVNGAISDSCKVTCGVPQGSILGPLFFIMFINDLSSSIQKSKVILYADDTALFYSSKSMEEIENALNHDLEIAYKWLQVNKLHLNVGKTEYMLVGCPQKLCRVKKELDLKVGTDRLNKASVYKYLGLYFDSTLSFDDHVEQICKKVNKRLGMLRRMHNYLNFDIRNTLYNSLVQPIIDYCSTAWSNTSKGHLSMLQVLQNRGARFVLGVGHRAHRRDMYSALKWLTIEQRFAHQQAVMVFKCINGKVPFYLQGVFQTQDNQHGHFTRGSSQGNLYIKRPNLEIYKKSFAYAGAQTWNALPKACKEATNLDNFKKASKSHFYGQGQGF